MQKLFENWRRFKKEAFLYTEAYQATVPVPVEVPEKELDNFTSEDKYHDHRASEMNISPNDYWQIFQASFLAPKGKGKPVILDVVLFDTASLKQYETPLFKKRVHDGWVKLCSSKPIEGRPDVELCDALKTRVAPAPTKKDLYNNKKSINQLKANGYNVVVLDDINFDNRLVQQYLEDALDTWASKTDDFPVWVQVKSGRRDDRQKAAFVMTVEEIRSYYSPDVLRGPPKPGYFSGPMPSIYK